ncbi:YdcF family protein [Mesobacterium sp. TK19101]|uniref:YdcF family protein n=1 Tax=Mesobacterium hydrothermale TaxID=3111907 RepID=A0ABU6HJT0_9RHOB|nr:YdcF family protein [Mesobacterium sp. TK19101]MEC3862698.1 YdcF family protein [Mesobacterium sp. TK19101]
MTLPTAIVLGAAVWPGGQPSPTLRRRALHAARLWHRGKVGTIIACGGLGQHPPSEAEVIRDLCIAEGVDPAAIRLEDRSATTEENLRLALPLLETRQVIIVTDHYHAPRARLVARRLGLDARSSSPPLRGSKPRAQIKAGLREIPAYLWYLLSGKGC